MLRISSTFYDWNIFAGYILSMLCIFMSRSIGRFVTGSKPYLYSFISILLTFLMTITFSRSGWLGAISGIAVLLMLNKEIFINKAIRYTIYLGSGLILCILAIVTRGFYLIFERIGTTITGEVSVMQHIKYGRAAMEMFFNSPSIGIGLAGFAPYYTRYFDINDLGTTSHSTVLSYFAQTGFIGAMLNFILLVFILFILYRSIKYSKQDVENQFLLKGIFTASIGIFVSNLFYFYDNQPFIWGLLGLGLAVAKQNGISFESDNINTDETK